MCVYIGLYVHVHPGSSPLDTPICTPPVFQHPANPRKSAHKGNWLLGFRSSKTPPTVMTDLYGCLKGLHFDWKVLEPYKVKARYPSLVERNEGQGSDDEGDGPGRRREIYTTEVIKIQLFLYKYKQRYHLDIQYVYGDMLLFCDIMKELVIKLEDLGHRSGIRIYHSHAHSHTRAHIDRRKHPPALLIFV